MESWSSDSIFNCNSSIWEAKTFCKVYSFYLSFILFRVKLLELVRNNSEMRTVEKHTQEKGDSVQAKRAQVR